MGPRAPAREGPAALPDSRCLSNNVLIRSSSVKLDQISSQNLPKVSPKGFITVRAQAQEGPTVFSNSKCLLNVWAKRTRSVKLLPAVVGP